MSELFSLLAAAGKRSIEELQNTGVDTTARAAIDVLEAQSGVEVLITTAQTLSGGVNENSALISQLLDDEHKLKDASIERELNTCKSVLSNVNINNEATQTATGYGTVALPKNAANGHMDINIEGVTLKNELNYNPTTWAEWEKMPGVVGDATGLEITAQSTAAINTTINTTLKPSTKYGVLWNVVSSTNNTTPYISGTQAVPAIGLSKTVGNGKAIATAKATIATNAITIQEDGEAAGNKIKFRDIRMFELPTGSEIESDFTNLTADELAVKYPYIQGGEYRSVATPLRIKSVGKNLLDISSLEVDLFNQVSTFQVVDGTIQVTTGSTLNYTYVQLKTIQLKPNTAYYIACNSVKTPTDSTCGLSVKDAADTTITLLDKSGVKNPEGTFTTLASGQVKLRLMSSGNPGAAGTVTFSSIMLNEGSTATPYEPYKESSLYLPDVDDLRSLPNGVYDEISIPDGLKVQRVQEYTLAAGDIITLITAGVSNLNYVTIQLPANCINVALNGSNIVLDGIGFANVYDDAARIGKWAAWNSTDRLIAVGVEIGTTLVAAKAALAGTKIWYQLATPIVTPIQPSGSLVSQPSGTVYIEKVIADAGVYDSGITVLNTGRPIATLESISKIDYTTGQETAIEVSTAVIAADGLSFTHASLADGDIVFFTYFYDTESTVGETALTYYDSRYVIKNEDDGKFYQWVIKASGTPPTATIELEEV